MLSSGLAVVRDSELQLQSGKDLVEVFGWRGGIVVLEPRQPAKLFPLARIEDDKFTGRDCPQHGIRAYESPPTLKSQTEFAHPAEKES